MPSCFQFFELFLACNSFKVPIKIPVGTPLLVNCGYEVCLEQQQHAELISFMSCSSCLHFLIFPCRFHNIRTQRCLVLTWNSCSISLSTALPLDRALLGKWGEMRVKAQHGKFGASTTNGFWTTTLWAHARNWTLALTVSKWSISCQLNKSKCFSLENDGTFLYS